MRTAFPEPTRRRFPCSAIHCANVLAGVAMLALVCGASPAGAQYSKTSTVDLVQTQLTVPKKVTAGKRFMVLDTVENQGETSAPTTITGFCLAKDNFCGEKDIRFAARRIPPLAAGASHAGESPIAVPDTVEAGHYFLVVIANANNDVEERHRENNTRSSAIEVEAKKRK